MINIQKKAEAIDENYSTGWIPLTSGNNGILAGSLSIIVDGITGTKDADINIYVTNDVEGLIPTIKVATDTIASDPYNLLVDIGTPYRFIKVELILNSITLIDTFELSGTFFAENGGGE